MAEAALYQAEDCTVDITAAAAYSAGEVIQLADGSAGIVSADVASGGLGHPKAEGVWTVTKTTSVVITAGQPVFWDHSANSATYAPVSDRDFYIGVAFADAASADTSMKVILNKQPTYKCDLARDGFQSVLAGTAAAGAFGYPVNLGGALVFELTATNEAQKVDALGVDGFTINSNWIAEGAFRVLSDGSGTATDVTIGVASGTHATDFQSVAEFAAIHLDGNDTNINAESDDGTTDVAPTDTTTDYTEGTTISSRVHFVIDGRDPASVKFYVNGVRVLSGTTFVLSAATGPLFPVVHVEKTSSTDTYKIAVDYLRVRTMQQD